MFTFKNWFNSFKTGLTSLAVVTLALGCDALVIH